MPDSQFFLNFFSRCNWISRNISFIGEFLTLVSVYSKSTLVAFISSLGVILAATYMLLLYKNVFLGAINSNIEKKSIQLNPNEVATFSILAISILIIGIKPNLILSYTTSSLERITTLYPIAIF